MKKDRAILMFFAGSCILPVTLLCLAMAGLEVLAFCLFSGKAPLFEEALEQIRFWIIILTVSVVCGIGEIVSKPGKNGKFHPGYLLGRLSVSEKRIFALQAFFNSLMFLLFWAAQVLAFLIMARIYSTQEFLPWGPQNLMAACYRSRLLHPFLPLEDTVIWIRNILYVIGFGIITAEYPYRTRYGGGERRKNVVTTLIAVDLMMSTTFLMRSILISLAVIISSGLAVANVLHEKDRNAVPEDEAYEKLSAFREPQTSQAQDRSSDDESGKALSEEGGVSHEE